MLLRLFYCLILSLALGSCASHYSGTITAPPQQLSNAKYVDIAIGYSSVNYFLGMGGRNQSTLVSQARVNLIKYADIQSNQTFENMSVDIVRSYFPFYMKAEAIVVADIVEREGITINYRDNSLYATDKLRRNNSSLIKLGESVHFNLSGRTFLEARVLELNEQGVKLYFIDNSDRIRIKNTKSKKVFKSSEGDLLKEQFGFKPGEIVKAKVMLPGAGFIVLDDLEIIGLNREYALLRSEKRGLYTAKLSDIQIVSAE